MEESGNRPGSTRSAGTLDDVNVLILLALATLPASAAVVLVALVLALTGGRLPAAQVSAGLGAALTVVWVVVTYQGGTRADETGTSESVFAEVGWLVAALACSVTSLVLRSRFQRPVTGRA